MARTLVKPRPKVSTAFRLEATLRERLIRIAEAEGVHVSALIEQIVKASVPEREAQIAARTQQPLQVSHQVSHQEAQSA